MTTSHPTESRVRNYLIYLVLDTSESMRRPSREAPQHGNAQEHFERLIPRMLRQLAAHPVLNKMAAASVVAFNDEPEILRPMTSLDRAASTNRPKIGYGTDYAQVLKFLGDQHTKDVRTVKLNRENDNYAVEVAAPWIFFITDGRPYARNLDQELSEWMVHRDRLVNPPIGARIVAIGLPGADRDTLYSLSTGQANGMRNAFIADRSSNLRELSESVVSAIESSISTSATTGLLTIRTPVGMSRIDGPRS
ncbi:VWA domain-containing protein [Dactylosporangium sp. NPDC049525]|uniref:vWA domain-containing protein n=1 Tax=Dactylosporangium sp. NPDC049525 TaxID=3154730 RepID=UPI00344530AB